MLHIPFAGASAAAAIPDAAQPDAPKGPKDLTFRDAVLVDLGQALARWRAAASRALGLSAARR